MSVRALGSAPVLVIVAVVIVAGIALKIGRYGDKSTAVLDVADAHVAAVMAAHGWHRINAPSGTAPPYPMAWFSRDSCPQPIVVAQLDGNAESAAFFRLQYGDDAGFVQGDVVAQPSGFDRQVRGLVQDLHRVVGDTDIPRLPVLAIAPTPIAAPGPCDGPPMDAWRSVDGQSVPYLQKALTGLR